MPGTHNRGMIISSINDWEWGNWISTYRRLKLDPYITQYKKINFKWVKDLNVRPKTLKLLEENTDLGLGNVFWI